MLKFHPEPGVILMCDFDKLGLKEPEMVKFRPVVVVSPRLKRRHGLLAVVPLSTTEPAELMPYHCVIELNPALPKPWDSPRMWAKADMIYTVRFERLDLVRTGRDQTGRRKYLTKAVSEDQLLGIRKCVLNGLGMSGLTKHLG